MTRARDRSGHLANGVHVHDLDRRGRRVQLATLAALEAAESLTVAELAEVLGCEEESLARRLRRYRRRGWVGRAGEAPLRYELRDAGWRRLAWIRARCVH